MSAKSVTGWVTIVGVTALSWKSQKQTNVAQSIVEVGYIAACSVSKECCYLKSILQESAFALKITVHCDSTSALSMIKNSMQRQKAKHFNVVYHWVRECFQRRRLLYVVVPFIIGTIHTCNIFDITIIVVMSEMHVRIMCRCTT